MDTISILSVNFQAYDFAALLIRTANFLSSEPHPIIIVDNESDSLKKQELDCMDNVKLIPQKTNIGHGEAINQGLGHVKSKYVLILDIDCHFLTFGWEKILRYFLEETAYKVVTVKGPKEKPIRPYFIFGETREFQGYDWRATPGYKGHRVTPDGFDVGIKAYHQMIADHLKIFTVNAQKTNPYETLNGEIVSLHKGCCNYPIIYHHWHGSHLIQRQVDFKEDLLEDKEKLFRHFPWMLDDYNMLRNEDELRQFI